MLIFDYIKDNKDNIILNSQLKRRKNTKLIIFDRPRVSYVGDLSDIPLELSDNTKFKYIFTLIDHFSKFSYSYLLYDKKKNQLSIHYKIFLIIIKNQKNFVVITDGDL